MSLFSSFKLLRVGLALAVALWMAGAGCLIGCESMASAASLNTGNPAVDSVATMVSGEACASAQSHHCCAKHGRSTSKPVTPSSNATDTSQLIGNSAPSMIDCPLALNATAVISKRSFDQAAVAVVSVHASDSVLPLSPQGRALSHPLRLPNRGHTYLRCCVFLI